MRDEEKTAWLLEHCVLERLREEIGLVFQRFYYFLVASSFLLTGFAALVAQRPPNTSDPGCQDAVMWVLIATGVLLSLGFWIINSWNARITSAYDERLRPDGEAWFWTRLGAHSLEFGFRALSREYDECLVLRRSLIRGLFCDLVSADKPAWFARYIPFVLCLVWLALAWVALWAVTDSYVSRWWLGPCVALGIAGIVAFITVLRPTSPRHSWLQTGEAPVLQPPCTGTKK